MEQKNAPAVHDSEKRSVTHSGSIRVSEVLPRFNAQGVGVPLSPPALPPASFWLRI